MEPARLPEVEFTVIKGRYPGFFQAFQVEGLDPRFLYAMHKH